MSRTGTRTHTHAHIHTHTYAHTRTHDRNLLDESVRHGYLYLSIHNRHKKYIMPPAGIEQPMSATKRPQTQAFDPATTEINYYKFYPLISVFVSLNTPNISTANCFHFCVFFVCLWISCPACDDVEVYAHKPPASLEHSSFYLHVLFLE